jgi:hypothetical protein
MIAFLTSFDRDVETVVRPHKKSGKVDCITFSAVPAQPATKDR